VTEALQVEASGETVGEAKWIAVRELEQLAPGLDKASIRFQVITEGERGLLGVGYEPARVIASVDAAALAVAPAREDEGEFAARARELVERIVTALGIRCRIDVDEDDDRIQVTCSGAELGLLIGKHGQTIDAVQYLANSIVFRGRLDERKQVVIDASGYRERRKSTLDGIAVRSAERAVETGGPVELEPMSAIERKVVHERLKDYPGVQTSSDGVEPVRFVVVSPA
jgi:spoIIIJ-associated protein